MNMGNGKSSFYLQILFKNSQSQQHLSLGVKHLPSPSHNAAQRFQLYS